MSTSLNLPRLETSLATLSGWIELGIVIACLVIGWAVDRRIALGRARSLEISPLSGRFARMAMPIVALLLLLVVRAMWTRYAPTPPLFVSVGISLALALAAIRIIVFTMRRLVPTAAGYVRHSCPAECGPHLHLKAGSNSRTILPRRTSGGSIPPVHAI